MSRKDSMFAALMGAALTGSAGMFTALYPSTARACACGCGVFDVGTATMLPSHPGLMLYLEDDYQNQNQNWVGSSSAPASANTDKEIQTHFGGVGLDYQVNNDWGISLKVPYWDRLFRTDIGSPGAPDITDYRHSALGDVRLQLRYTGLADDLSTGLSVGLKLPTGDWTYPNFDRDTSIGTGTTDLLLGAYHIGSIPKAAQLQWFVEALYDRAFNSREGYRPGNELDVAAGLFYSGLQVGSKISVVPLLQLIGSDRLRDSGVNADPLNSGYHRLLISPGAEVGVGKWKFYADAEFHIYHYANAAPSVAVEGTQGQLVAPVLIKAMLSYQF